MNDTAPHTETGPAEAISQLGESLAQAGESHRALVQEMTVFTKFQACQSAKSYSMKRQIKKKKTKVNSMENESLRSV